MDGSILACPDCGRGLDAERCACGAVFPVREDLRLLLPSALDPVTRAFYESADEDRYGRPEMPEREAALVRAFLDGLDRDATVVELGSGRCHFAGWHPGLLLTDYSFRALARFGRGPRVQLDAERLPFRDGALDAVFSIATLEHVPRPERVLAEIDRCLAPGGRALLFPAWHVGPWQASGVGERRWSELGVRERAIRATIPLRTSAPHRFAAILPGRLRREAQIARGEEVPFTYRRLRPALDRYVASDSDAFTSLDPHACAAFFLSRGYRVRGAERLGRRLLMRYGPVEVTKGPGAPAGAAR